MSTKDFLNLGRETNKGSALHALKDEGAAGAYDFAVLDVSGITVDQDTFRLGYDQYEVNVVLTDTVAESVAIVEVGDTTIVFDAAWGIAGLPGDVIRMEDEYMIVIDYNAANKFANVLRGQFGSTEAEHSIANSDTFQAAQPVAAGNFACPLDDTAAAASVIDIAAAVQFWSDGGYSKGLGGGIGVRVENGLKVDAVSGVADSVVFAYPADGGVADNSDGLDSVTVDFTDGGTGEDYLEAVDGTDFVELGVTDGETITIGSAVANDGAYVVTGVDPRVVDAFGVEVTPSKISVATASWTDEAQGDAITIAQADAWTNGTLTAFGGGVEPASQLYSVIWYVWTAADVTANSKEFYAPFDVTEAVVSAFESDGSPHRTQSGTDELNFDGAVTVTANRLVSVAEGTNDQLAADDIIKLEFFG